MKKKLSLGLVLAIVLILAAMTALATALLWEQQVIPMKEIEQTEGDYIHWPASQKQVLVHALIDSGHIEENTETARLFDDATDETEKHAIADQLILALTGQTDVKEISVDIITYAIMGSPLNWTPAQLAWWQEVTNLYWESDNPDTLVVPEHSDLSEEQAIAIARNAIMSVYDFSEAALDNALQITYLYTTEDRPHYRRWSVTFQQYREGSDSEFAWGAHATVDNAGNVIGDIDMGEPFLEGKAARDLSWAEEELPPIIQAYCDYAEYEESYLVRDWCLEGKAEYSKELRPQVLAALEKGDLTSLTNFESRFPLTSRSPMPNREIIASTTFAYGLPKEDDIPIDDARDLARLLVWKRYGLEEQTSRDSYSYYEYYDITNPDLPLWKFVFYPDSFEGMSSVPVYKVMLNAHTGETVTVERYDWKEIYDGTPHHSIWY